MISSLQENVMPLGLMEADRPAAAASFISTLLNRGLASGQHEIIVDFNEMVCDRAKRFDLFSSVTVKIEEEIISDSRDSKEITVSGTMKNGEGFLKKFYFYLVTCWSPFHVDSISESIGKNKDPDFLSIQVNCPCEYVSDTVFEINLFHQDSKGIDVNLGHGRGFIMLEIDNVAPKLV